MNFYLKMFALLSVSLFSLNAHSDGLVIRCADQDCTAFGAKTLLYESNDTEFSNFYIENFGATASTTTKKQYIFPGHNIDYAQVFMLQKYSNGNEVDLNFDTVDEAQKFCDKLSHYLSADKRGIYEQSDTEFNEAESLSQRRPIAVGIGSQVDNSAKKFYYCPNPWNWASDFQKTITKVTINNKTDSTLFVRQDTNNASLATIDAHKSAQLWVNNQNDTALFTKNSYGVLNRFCIVSEETFNKFPIINASGTEKSPSCEEG